MIIRRSSTCAVPLRLLTQATPVILHQVLRLQSSYNGLRYNISCTVSKGDRETTVSGYLLARTPPALPIVRLDGLPAGLRVGPATRLVLGATVDSVAPDQLQLLWTQKSGPRLNLSDPTVRETDKKTALLSQHCLKYDICASIIDKAGL